MTQCRNYFRIAGSFVYTVVREHGSVLRQTVSTITTQMNADFTDFRAMPKSLRSGEILAGNYVLLLVQFTDIVLAVGLETGHHWCVVVLI